MSTSILDVTIVKRPTFVHYQVSKLTNLLFLCGFVVVNSIILYTPLNNVKVCIQLSSAFPNEVQPTITPTSIQLDDQEFEFDRKKLTLGDQIGSGAFGRVVKADALGIMNKHETTPVAVKMVKRDADIIYIKALMAELKIMIHLGKVSICRSMYHLFF